MAKPSSSLAILMGADKTAPAPAGTDGDAGGVAAAQDLLDAIEAKDASAVWEAMKSLHTLCDNYEGGE